MLACSAVGADTDSKPDLAAPEVARKSSHFGVGWFAVLLAGTQYAASGQERPVVGRGRTIGSAGVDPGPAVCRRRAPGLVRLNEDGDRGGAAANAWLASGRRSFGCCTESDDAGQFSAGPDPVLWEASRRTRFSGQPVCEGAGTLRWPHRSGHHIWVRVCQRGRRRARMDPERSVLSAMTLGSFG